MQFYITTGITVRYRSTLIFFKRVITALVSIDLIKAESAAEAEKIAMERHVKQLGSDPVGQNWDTKVYAESLSPEQVDLIREIAVQNPMAAQ